MLLRRRFSSLTLLILSINGTIGSAWLFAPLYSAKIAGTGSIIAWLIGGIAAILIAMTFTELSVLIPVTGGTVQIPQLSHGTTTSFFFSWLAWIAAVSMAPIEVQAVLQYASSYSHFSFLLHSVRGVPVLTHTGLFCAGLLMLGLCILNATDLKNFVRFNKILFAFKTLVIILAITSLIITSHHTENFQGFTDHLDWKSILQVAGGIDFAFIGFKHAVELAGEAKNERHSIPIAIIGSVIMCLILYLGLQVAFIAALHPTLLNHGWGALTFEGDVAPLTGLVISVGLLWLLKLLYIDSAVSPLGVGLIYVTSSARLLYAMSNIGFLPQLFMKLNKQALPVAAIFLNFLVGLLLFLPSPGWQSMVEFLVSGMVLSYAMGPIAVLALRKELPDEKRFFKVPFSKITCFLAFYACNLICYWTGWEALSKLLIAIIIGFLFFLWAAWRRQTPPLHLRSALWILPYLAGLIFISYFGSFGGQNKIPFGWDLLVIALFSILILYWAVRSHLRGPHAHFHIFTRHCEIRRTMFIHR